MKKLILVLAVLLIVQGNVFAQAKTSLNIQCNQTGARVYLNDNLAGYASPNFSILVNPGLYTVRVAKDGFPDFKTTVVVGSSPITINAKLGGGNYQPPPSQPVVQHQLSVESSISGAKVFINGVFGGFAPYVGYFRSGTYTIVVRGDGYEEYTQTVKLGSAYRVYASLSPAFYPVFIDSQATPGASVFKDSVFVGTTPYRGSWASGSYTLRIVAQGYNEYYDKVLVAGPLTMQVALTPSYVDFEIRMPESFGQSSGKSLSFKNVDLYLDGAKLDTPYGRTLPGVHRLMMVINGNRFETQFELAPGRFAVIEPYFGVTIR